MAHTSPTLKLRHHRGWPVFHLRGWQLKQRRANPPDWPTNSTHGPQPIGIQHARPTKQPVYKPDPSSLEQQSRASCCTNLCETSTTLHSDVMVMGGIISGFRQSHLWIGLGLISHHRNLLMPASSKDLLGFCRQLFSPSIKSLNAHVSLLSLVDSSYT